jgi:hypothetical protein
MRLPSSIRTATLSAALALCLAACGGNDDAPPAAQISVLGTRADLVTDGDARVQVQLVQGANPATAKVLANGRDVTSAFTNTNGTLVGLVTGLTAGANSLTVTADGYQTAQLAITNTSRGGPVISGPQQTPFYCATVTAQPAAGNAPATLASGLSTEAVDAQCNIATEYKYFYKTTAANCSLATPDPSPPATPPANACFKPYNPAAAAPADLATTTTDSGQTVPYIVRVERGTMNRGIYDLAVLVDPSKPLDTQPTWNGKVQFVFGGGGGQPRRQMRPATVWTDEDALSRGWIVTNNSMTDASINNNRIVSAETVLMMKEHIVDRYGPVRFVVGKGNSGGSITAYGVSSVYPGLLDGALIYQSLLDYDTSHTLTWECSQLVEVFDSTPWKNAMAAGAYTQAQINAKKAAVSGHLDHTVCQAWYNSFGQGRYAGVTTASRTVPVANRDTGTIVVTQLATPVNNCQLPTSVVYDPVTNPNGVRCGVWDWMASVFGTTSGGGNSTRDNTGIQYGLQALRSGAITAEEFVVLNENVGGVGRDGALRTARAVADAPALDTAYRTGLVTARNMGSIAIIDMRGWDDSQLSPNGGITPGGGALHEQWRSFGVRARLDQANGHHDNQVIWRFGRTGLNPSATMFREALLEMDKWLTALKADTSGAAVPQKVVQAKPSTTFDFCLLSTDVAQATKVTDQATCDADPLLKPRSSPRQVAGGPRAENILKCQLKPIDVADYGPATLNANQLSRLQALFTGGVCDWSKPGVSQQPTGEAPFTFMPGPGGQPLGSPPSST